MCLPTGSPSPFAWASTRAALCTRLGIKPNHDAAPAVAPPAQGVPVTEDELRRLVNDQRARSDNPLVVMADRDGS